MQLAQVLDRAADAVLAKDWKRATCRFERAKRLTQSVARKATLDACAKATALKIRPVH